MLRSSPIRRKRNQMRFGTPKQALDFLSGASGDFCVSPLARPSSSRLPQPRTSTPLSTEVSNEPTIPYPSVSRVQMTELKKTIEKDEIEKFRLLVSANPRLLINTSGDTATILMEGCRYNGLHIAAKNGRSAIMSALLDYVTDIQFLADCYGTDRADAEFRRTNIISSYLNTPDKGNCDVPLHIAAKFGHVDSVRVLTLQPLCNRGAKNKEGLKASDVVCSRYNGDDKALRKREMDLLLNGCFVALYRSRDNSQPAKIVVTDNYPHTRFDRVVSPSLSDCLLPLHSLAACAGPFPDRQTAQNFHQRWSSEGKDVKLTDIDKGYERVGRGLVAEIARDKLDRRDSEIQSIEWAESWFFLGDGLVNLDSDEGLTLLNAHLRSIRIRGGQAAPARNSGSCAYGSSGDCVRTKLNFDDDGEDESFAPLSSTALAREPPESAFSSPISQEDVFEDAVDHLPPSQTQLDESLTSFTERFAALKLDSPAPVAAEAVCSPVVRRISDEEDFDDPSFSTPPATPPPLFLLDQPTKTDNDLLSALSRVSSDRLSRFPLVHGFVDKLSRLEVRQRADWPGKDSPRRQRGPRLFTRRS